MGIVSQHMIVRSCCRSLRLLLVISGLLTLELAGETAAPATKTIAVRRATGAIDIDGYLDEEDWRSCEVIPLTGYLPDVSLSDSTWCRLLWDDSYLYLSWNCSDNDAWNSYLERDQPLYNQEVVEAFINPDGDRETYIELEVSPFGTLWDGKITISGDGRDADISWNSALVSAVRVVGTVNDNSDKDSTWTVEMALPLAEVEPAEHLPPRDGDSWRLNLYRVEIPGRNKTLTELSAWSPVSGNTFHDPDSFGEIVFSTQPVRLIRGDTDGNGKINIFDLLYLLGALRNSSAVQDKPACDVDGNQRIDIFDVLGILKLLRG